MGACVQLYTLRSEHNWGIGDFGDLKQMLEQVGERGGSFIGLNPIHALYPANPHSASPYSPSSRRWLNVIYIDINRIEEFPAAKPRSVGGIKLRRNRRWQKVGRASGLITR